LFGAGHADLGQADAEGTLAGDEGGTAGRAALLAVVIREHGALIGDLVDIGGLVPHQPMAVGADVGDADIVAHDDKDVGFLGHCVACTDGQTKPGQQKHKNSFGYSLHGDLLSFDVRC